MKTVVIGDVHGCIDELHELLDKVGYSDSDRLIFVGDLVDRGPDSAGVVALARKLKAECVMGNHEEKHLRWRRHEGRKKFIPGYTNPMKPYNEKRQAEYDSLSEEDWDYLEKLPNMIRIGQHFAVIHAGAMPGVTLDDQVPNHLLRLRYIRKADGKMASLNELGEHIGPLDEKYQFWPDVWDGPEILIYGHHVHVEPRASIKVGWNVQIDPETKVATDVGIRAIGIDTGCCFGMSLSALVLNDKDRYTRTVSVPARREYVPYRKDDREYWCKERPED